MFCREILIVIPILYRELPWCHIEHRSTDYMQYDNHKLLSIQSIQRFQN